MTGGREEVEMSYVSIGHYTAIALLKEACPSGLVVDAGAFPGKLTRLLARHWKVIALDKEPDRGLTAQQRFKDGLAKIQEETFAQAMHQLGITTVAADLETDRWPIDDSTADAIVLTEVIEHLYVDPLHALLEANRVLKPGGVLLISTPNLLSLRNRMNFLRGDMARVIQPPFLAFLQKSRLGHLGHVRLYAPSELQEMLSSLGFQSSLHFYRFGFWDAAPGSVQPLSPETALPAPRRSFVRKLLRPPGSYVNAGIATARTLLEKAVPEYRPHMYAIARKVRMVTDADLAVSEFKSA
jgi:SAM-dependent methyltransferase